jgi:hypothetical protein
MRFFLVLFQASIRVLYAESRRNKGEKIETNLDRCRNPGFRLLFGRSVGCCAGQRGLILQ